MTYTDSQLKRINYLRASVRLQAPETETDIAYKFTNDDLYGILEVVTPVHAKDFTIDTLPDSMFYFTVLLAKREIYYRLASSTAPFYPLSAEGAKLEKNVRFDHYLSLVKVTMEEYDSLTSSGGSGSGSDDLFSGTISTYQATLGGDTYFRRFMELADSPEVTLTVGMIGETSANLDWTRFDSTLGVNFMEYRIYVDTNPIYDEYGILPISPLAKPVFVSRDVRRTKIRVDELIPDTTYYALVETETRHGLKGYSQVEFKTEAVVIPDATI